MGNVCCLDEPATKDTEALNPHQEQPPSSQVKAERDAEARAMAASAAQQRAENFEKTAHGRAARAHAEAASKKSSPASRPEEPVLKWQMGG
ncbi:hypothetical protein KP509_13G081900 [Ceratopteris richardii]|uniref:Uncharacterized protein n=1 Tax=Ceratopteris richardii TaxID=49495 RepID=A0A8T2TF61_CERRI|nr:hypothetical protein KP509_13G081900 [Ceratopteris richardii]